jgi:acetylornithine deacetylase/succinyl-diaminopimelate desuccinylase-like protein
MPAAEPNPIQGRVYRAIERVLRASSRSAVVVPFMSRGATDGAFLRARGVAVYGVPLFVREDGAGRAHGNDERISIASLEAGTELLWKIVLEVAGTADETRAE